MSPETSQNEQATQTEEQAQEQIQEQRLIRRLQMMMNLVLQTIAQDSSLTIDEAAADEGLGLLGEVFAELDRSGRWR